MHLQIMYYHFSLAVIRRWQYLLLSQNNAVWKKTIHHNLFITLLLGSKLISILAIQSVLHVYRE